MVLFHFYNFTIHKYKYVFALVGLNFCGTGDTLQSFQTSQWVIWVSFSPTEH